MNKIYPLKFKPVYKEKVWGGQKLKTVLNKDIPNNVHIGESWELVDRGNDVSIIKNGYLSSKTIREAIKDLGSDLIGTKNRLNQFNRFPLLIKFLDSSEKLSVQVHPDDALAKKFKEQDTGKSEMWYVIQADPNTKIVYGCDSSLKKQNHLDGFSKNMEKLLNFVSIEEGDLIFIPAGQVHALLGGCVILEIQQNSDVTYRLYDWGRMGLDGKPRELHLKKAMDSMKLRKPRNSYQKVLAIKEKNSKLIECDYFKTNLINIRKPYTDICDKSTYKILIPIAGKGSITYKDGDISAQKGDLILMPASLGKFTINPSPEMKLISIT